MTGILAFSGSSRRGSYNRHVLDKLSTMATAHGASITQVDLGALDIPVYNADDESSLGLPAGVRELRALLSEHQGLMIACPEYNGFITPLLLNCIDWATRSGDGGLDVTPFFNKPAAIASASPGAFGGMRSAGHLRTLLSGIGCLVLPVSLTVPSSTRAFDEDGEFTDERIRQRAELLVTSLIDLTAKVA